MNIFVISFILLIVQSILTLGHLFIGWSILRLLAPSIPARKMYTWSAIGSTWFTAMTFITQWIYHPITAALYTASAIWLGTVYCLGMACLMGWIIWIIRTRISHNKNPIPHFMSLLFVCALVISGYGVWHSYQIRVVPYTVHLAHLPARWEGARLGVIADQHLGDIRNKNSLVKTVALLNQEHIDALLILGDFYDGPPAPYANMTEPLLHLKAPLGIYFINGNHERFQNNQPYLQALRAAGVTPLIDEVRSIDGLQLIGVDDLTTRSRKDFRHLLDRLPFDPTRPSILLKHIPSFLDLAAQKGITLSLHGHTHNGQIWPMNWLMRWIYDGFEYGWHTLHGMQIYTTSGVGTWGPPQRIGSQAEIVIMTLTNTTTHP